MNEYDEPSPKKREHEPQFNKYLLDSYAPILLDITNSEDIGQSQSGDINVHQTVVVANGDYYAIKTTDTIGHKPNNGLPLSSIEIIRLLHQSDEVPYSILRSYYFDTSPSTRAITSRTAQANAEQPGKSFEVSLINDPNETLLLLGQFATIDEQGQGHLSCEIISADSATEIIRRHEIEKTRLMKGIEQLRESRTPRVKKGWLDKILGSSGNSKRWK